MISARLVVLAVAFVLQASAPTAARHIGPSLKLSTVVRTANPNDVNGLFSLEYKFDPEGSFECPSSINHTTWRPQVKDSNVIVMEHHTIVQDGERCEGTIGGKSLLLFQSDYYDEDFTPISDAEPPIPKDLINYINSSGLNHAIVNTLNRQKTPSGITENYFFGYEQFLRECGDRSIFRDGTTAFVVRPYKDFTIFKIRWDFYEGKRYLIMVPKYMRVVCVYSNYLKKTIPSPTVSPEVLSESGSPEPTPDMIGPSKEPEPTMNVDSSGEDGEDGESGGDGAADGEEPSPDDGSGTESEGEDDDETGTPSVSPMVSVSPDPDDSQDDSADPSAEPSEEPSSSGVCFPSFATVRLMDGSTKRMDELRSGDVLVGKGGRASRVFGFSHSDRQLLAQFVLLRTESGHGLRTTPRHFVYANGRAVAAKSVKLGDMLTLGDGTSKSSVVEIRTEVWRGVFNPQTEDGDIVVDGVLASTFTGDVEPLFAHAALAPLRALGKALGGSRVDLVGMVLDGGLRSMIAAVPKA